MHAAAAYIGVLQLIPLAFFESNIQGREPYAGDCMENTFTVGLHSDG